MVTNLAATPQAVDDERRDVVQRVAASASFQRSPKLRELFLYICERAMQNRPEDLREQLIGRGVFGRKPDYNPGEDNIVRVEIRQLRKRLEEYFATEGKEESQTILIPKGAYVPVFEPRVVTPQAAGLPQTPVAPQQSKWRAYPWWFWAQNAALLSLLVACGWLWSRDRATDPAATGNTHQLVSRAGPWPSLFNNDQPTQIVCADSTLVLAQAVVHHSITLQDYVARNYAGDAKLSSEGNFLLNSIQGWQFTDMTDARLVQKLYRLNSDHWDKVSVRSARTTQVQDFKTGNTILLGSKRSNPWNTLFEPMLNFQFDYDEQNHIALIRNRNPRPGEKPVYQAAKTGESGDTYSLIALVPNLRHTGSVLIIAGANAESTEAAGEFILNPESAARLMDSRNSRHVQYFEVLLKSGTLAGVAKNADIVSERTLPDTSTRD